MMLKNDGYDGPKVCYDIKVIILELPPELTT